MPWRRARRRRRRKCGVSRREFAPRRRPIRRSTALFLRLLFALARPDSIFLRPASIRLTNRSWIAFSFARRSALLHSMNVSWPSGPATAFTSTPGCTSFQSLPGSSFSKFLSMDRGVPTRYCAPPSRSFFVQLPHVRSSSASLKRECAAPRARSKSRVVTSARFPAKTSYPRGNPPGVVTRPITTCFASGLWSREYPRCACGFASASPSKYVLIKVRVRKIDEQYLHVRPEELPNAVPERDLDLRLERQRRVECAVEAVFLRVAGRHAQEFGERGPAVPRILDVEFARRFDEPRDGEDTGREPPGHLLAAAGEFPLEQLLEKSISAGPRQPGLDSPGRRDSSAGTIRDCRSRERRKTWI